MVKAKKRAKNTKSKKKNYRIINDGVIKRFDFKITKIRALLFVLIVAGIGTYFFVRSQAGTYSYLLPPSGSCPNEYTYSLPQEDMRQAMACEVNKVRQRSGRSVLDYRLAMHYAAVDKAYNILRCNYFAHSGWNASGTCYVHSMDYYLNKRGVMYLCRVRGENLRWGQYQYGYVRYTVDAWLNSDSHRGVMLAWGYRYGGTGVARGTMAGKPYSSIWVHYFCQQ